MDGGAFTYCPAALLEELGAVSSSDERGLSAETRRTLLELEKAIETMVIPALRASDMASPRHLGLPLDSWRHLKNCRMAFVSSLVEDLAQSGALQREFREAYRRGPEDLVARLAKRERRGREVLERVARVMRATTTDLEGLGDLLDVERSSSLGWMLEGHHLFREVIDAATALDAILIAVSLVTRSRRAAFSKGKRLALLAQIESAARHHQDAVGPLVVALLEQQGRLVDVTQSSPMWVPPGVAIPFDDASPLPPGAREWAHAGR